MNSIGTITKKLERFASKQYTIELTALAVFTLATVLIATVTALLVLRSPLYGLVGLIPVLLFRPVSLIERARTLEEKLSLRGELINSIQLAHIPEKNKENYSRELIESYIDKAAAHLKTIDFSKYVNYKPLHNALFIILVSIGLSLLYPALWPTRFWYALHHTIYHTVEPHPEYHLAGTDVRVALYLDGVYIPHTVELLITQESTRTKERVAVHEGTAATTLRVNTAVSYAFHFLDETTDEYRLTPLEPLHIEALSFNLHYPAHTRLADETKTGRQLIAPSGTEVTMYGRATQVLVASQFILKDTIDLVCEGKHFSGDFSIRESGTATLYLASQSEHRENIVIYAIPDLSPLVDIFYPGYNINVPNDMRIGIGIRCSDDYGLARGTFHYTFESETTRTLDVHRGALEDTLSFTWDLSELGLLPGDELSYYARVTDNAGHTSQSRTYRIYFPTMEEIYEEVSEQQQHIAQDLKDIQSMHEEETEEMTRIREKIMKERTVQWADEEKLREIITSEQELLERVDEWRAELEETIEKLNEGVVLDQESLERLREITEIMQEIAPDDLRQALERLQTALEKKPRDIQNALENLKKHQEDLANMLERTLELLRRYQQEQRLGELAQEAQELSEQAETLDELSKNQELDVTNDTESLREEIEALAQALEELANSEGLEENIQQVLEELAQATQNTAASSSISQMKLDLKQLAADLNRLYEELTRGRTAQLRKNLLEVMNQLIDISKAQERLVLSPDQENTEQQEQIMSATRVVAESLYAQQTKSLYVTPSMGRNLAQALINMKRGQEPFHAREAMKYLNVVCYEMLRNMEKVSQGKSSTGMDNFFQQLSQITQGQMSLNQSMSGFTPLPLAVLTPGQKAQLQRLAGKQRALREALEGLRTETGAQPGEILDHVIEEMKKAEEALYQYKIDRELIERQRHVLSKLLDTQRSIRKEDYGRQRTSKPGGEVLVQQRPAPLASDLGRDQLRELLQKALRETYPEEYEYYIREYFERLLEEQ
ncbi:hypothetical protein AMJ87_08155 [candidate division WOR_3 bacterium SM23_60]|uniref:DUF4175 domain-containing protein n=1 Tax=candidate division WOR_3 bacterium SM23_60 TaxID=1703780 RepID=A0A0S8GGH8_UNCW3|nr:MAG: hypothetical protein AMJ87_08155 [candidate division WOR_3 bacterium SM23_60]